MNDLHFRRGTYKYKDQFDTDLIRLIKGKGLVVNTNFFNREFRAAYSLTPFPAVRFAQPAEILPPEHRQIIEDINFSCLTEKGIAMEIRRSLKSYFKKAIQKDRYIVFHSAGYDSRIISLVMMELRDEDHDMSRVHFRCYQPEGPMFLEIMKRQGWPRGQYSVFEGSEEDYYDIGRPDRPLNGWQNYNQQMNFWSDIVENEKEWIVITGTGGELFKFMAAKDPMYYPQRTQNKNLNLLLNRYPGEGEWEGYYRRVFKDVYLPFFSFDYLNVSLFNAPEVSFDGKRDNVRMEVVRSFIDSHRVDCLNIRYGEHNYTWNLSKKRKRFITEWFYNSLLYKKYTKYIPKGLDFTTDLYGHEAKLWGFATLYEHVNNGIEK